MSWYAALALMLGGLIGFLALGLPVAFAFLAVNIAGAMLFLGGEAGLGQLVRNTADAVTRIELAPIPLFLLMGELMYRSQLAERAIDAVDRLIVRVPGRIAVVAVTGGTIFSALSGSTIATTAMLGNTMLPGMLKRGYRPVMAMGPIMAIGGVDMLIPPSALTVLLASLGKIPVAELLIAGIVPGLVMSLLFVGYIVVRCAIDPTLAPADRARERSLRERIVPFLVFVVPLFIIVFVVIGSMFAGIASPTDSAALGCVATVLLALCYRSINVTAIVAALIETALVTVMVLFIIAASYTFAQILALSGATDGALGEIGRFELGRLVLILLMIGILLVLGCFLDQVSMMLLTLPFFMPLVANLHIDSVWFGVLFLISMQIGLLTPPFGLLLFVMKGVAPPETTMAEIFAAAAPFIVIMFGVLLLVLAFPFLATWLPRML